MKPKLLIVDDKVTNILVVEGLLSDLDVEFVRAMSGPEAIDKAATNEFALVLMDVQMPGMDGFEAVEIIRKRLRMEVAVDEKIPVVIMGDSVRLSQVLINLLGNAIKFTHTGGITISVGMLQETTDLCTLHFRVIDTGIGIPADKQQYIFESFTQASSSTTRKYGGTGLGLAITQKLVGLQGGELNLSSEEGLGSTFLFTLTFAKSAKEQIDDDMVLETTFRSLRGLKVLVAEDNVINQKIVSKYLNKWDVVVELAENGKIAYEKVVETRYDVVLMDLHMPEMSGYDATSMIRSTEGEYYSSLPIIALTASAFLDERDKIYTFGMSGYIIKPFNPAELYWKIAPFLKQ